MEEKINSACVLVIGPGGRILAVSRKDDHDDFGLPGGKLENNETSAEAAVRELKEETGLNAKAENMIPIYSGLCAGNWSEAFLCRQYSGEIQTAEKGLVKWVDYDVVLQGSFGEFNRELFRNMLCVVNTKAFRGNKLWDVGTKPAV